MNSGTAKVAIVGAGPAGALAGYHLARSGISVTLFDASHPREKPCGGGLTAKALALLPTSTGLPARWIDECRFESAGGTALTLALSRPVAIGSRREMDAWLLEQATRAGATHIAERVVEVRAESDVTVRTAQSSARSFDFVIGADGAGSLVRRTFLGPLPPSRLTMATGWFASGTSDMTIRFVRGLAGYVWLFPRLDHVGVGICAPLGAMPTRDLVAQLEAEALRHFPAFASLDGERYAHTIPSPSTDPASIREIAGPRWALLGDAAALADPITGEGIYYALRSAVILSDTLRETGNLVAYPERVLEDCGRDLIKAAKLHARFYAAGFTDRMLRFSAGSSAIRDVLADLVLGDQGYIDLKKRLVRSAPKFLWQSAMSAVGRES